MLAPRRLRRLTTFFTCVGLGFVLVTVRKALSMSKTKADSQRADPLHFDSFSFGMIRIDGHSYEHDVIIDRGEIRKRNKKPSKKFRAAFGHTPLSIEEDIPWKCRRLIIGTGGGALPVMEEVKEEARRRNVELAVLPTAEAIKAFKENPAESNAILHVTC
jgi:hypothetical protein